MGPEGDFTKQEYDQALQIGFEAVSLGRIVMRVETATLYGLSVLKYLLEKRLHLGREDGI